MGTDQGMNKTGVVVLSASEPDKCLSNERAVVGERRQCQPRGIDPWAKKLPRSAGSALPQYAFLSQVGSGLRHAGGHPPLKEVSRKQEIAAGPGLAVSPHRTVIARF